MELIEITDREGLGSQFRDATNGNYRIFSMDDTYSTQILNFKKFLKSQKLPLDRNLYVLRGDFVYRRPISFSQEFVKTLDDYILDEEFEDVGSYEVYQRDRLLSKIDSTSNKYLATISDFNDKYHLPIDISGLYFQMPRLGLATKKFPQQHNESIYSLEDMGQIIRNPGFVISNGAIGGVNTPMLFGVTDITFRPNTYVPDIFPAKKLH